MALIGSLGSLVFSVSGDRALTYNEIGEKSSGRWTKHDLIGVSPISEFLGPEQDEITLKIKLSSALGINTDAAYALMRSMVRSGSHMPLIIGGVPQGNSDWYIANVGSVSTHFSPKNGSVLWRECDITLKEYH